MVSGVSKEMEHFYFLGCLFYKLVFSNDSSERTAQRQDQDENSQFNKRGVLSHLGKIEYRCTQAGVLWDPTHCFPLCR